MINPVRIALVRVGQGVQVVDCYPYDFRRMVEGFFGHRHLSDGPDEQGRSSGPKPRWFDHLEPGLVLGYREPRIDVEADLEQPAPWYVAEPRAPFFYCRAGIEGGFASLTDSDIAAIEQRFAWITK